MADIWQSKGWKINTAAQGTDGERDKHEAETANSSSTDMDAAPVG